MRQTESTAIVLRAVNYRENDKMLTLFSPTRGRVEALARGCRRPKSPLLNAAELFALGDFELYEKGSHLTVTGAALTETFYPLRQDFDRLACGTYLLNVCECTIQPGQEAQELFMLLLHTLSRLTFTDQPWRPLLTGFLTHYTACEGFRPRLKHCVRCGRRLEDQETVWFDLREGGVVCEACRGAGMPILPRGQRQWLEMALTHGSAAWVDTPEMYAPLGLMRRYVEQRVEQPLRAAGMLGTIEREERQMEKDES